MLGAFVDLERKYSGPGLCRDDGDAVRADELPEDVRAHRVGQPQLYGWVLAVARSVQCTVNPILSAGILRARMKSVDSRLSLGVRHQGGG